MHWNCTGICEWLRWSGRSPSAECSDVIWAQQEICVGDAEWRPLGGWFRVHVDGPGYGRERGWKTELRRDLHTIEALNRPKEHARDLTKLVTHPKTG